jgi:hypothetical protein
MNKDLFNYLFIYLKQHEQVIYCLPRMGEHAGPAEPKAGVQSM